jgi:hypothetical protein
MPRAGGAAAHREALRERQVGFGVDHELDALLAAVVVRGAYRSRDEPVGAPLPDPRGAGQPQPTLRLEPPQLRAVIPEEAEHRSPWSGLGPKAPSRTVFVHTSHLRRGQTAPSR